MNTTENTGNYRVSYLSRRGTLVEYTVRARNSREARERTGGCSALTYVDTVDLLPPDRSRSGKAGRKG